MVGRCFLHNHLVEVLTSMKENHRSESTTWNKTFRIWREVCSAKEFVRYDFAQPLQLPGEYTWAARWGAWCANQDQAELKGRFDRIICDPPFLSSDCQTKGRSTAKIIVNASQTDARSCSDYSMACKIMVITNTIWCSSARWSTRNPVYRRKNGESCAEAVRKGWSEDDHSLAAAYKRPQ